MEGGIKMSKYPKLRIEPPEKGTVSDNWGEFISGPKMPWGPWRLTSEPKQLFKFKGITVVECFANEHVEDSQGYVAGETLAHDPGLRHFLVGQAADGNILWWYNLGHRRYNVKNEEFYEATISLEGKDIVVKGYGWEVEPGEEVHIDTETGKVLTGVEK